LRVKYLTPSYAAIEVADPVEGFSNSSRIARASGYFPLIASNYALLSLKIAIYYGVCLYFPVIASSMTFNESPYWSCL